MKLYDPEISNQLSSESMLIFFLLELQASVTLRYNNLDIDIYFESNKYTAREFLAGEIDIASALSVDTLVIEISDPDSVLAAVFLSEDVRNKGAILHIASCGPDSNNATVWGSGEQWEYGVDWAEVTQNTYIAGTAIFRGIISGWEIEDDKVVVRIVNELAFWNKKAMRICSVSCPWIFKGTECTYSGAESWCDKSYDRCAALSNNLNFGGFRFAAQAAEKEVWWGRQRGTYNTPGAVDNSGGWQGAP